MTDREDAFNRIWEEFKVMPECAPTMDDLRRYVLIEESTNDGNTYATTHTQMADASDYWTTQENREDWDPLVLIDMETGVRFWPDIQVTWVRAPTAVATAGHSIDTDLTEEETTYD